MNGEHGKERLANHDGKNGADGPGAAMMIDKDSVCHTARDPESCRDERFTIGTDSSSQGGIGQERGFTLLSVLFMMVLFSIALMQANRYWSTTLLREREQELLFRGNQIQQAIKSYYHSAPNEKDAAYPSNLKLLLKDNRYLTVKRHLRKLYKDPMTPGGAWGLIRDDTGRIKGVFSKSKGNPKKKAGFPEKYEDFSKAKTYKGWRFVYEANQS